MQLPPGMSALLQLNVAGTALNIAPRRCAADRPFGRIDERAAYRQRGVTEESVCHVAHLQRLLGAIRRRLWESALIPTSIKRPAVARKATGVILR
jgi:hypothetical protein